MSGKPAEPVNARDLFDAAGRGEVPVWAFVANHLSVTCKLPLELISGHVLRDARPDEVEAVTNAIPGLGTYEILPVRPPRTPYVVERNACAKGAGLNDGFLAIEEASRLTAVPLDLSLVCIGPARMRGGAIGAIPFAQLGSWQRNDSVVDDAYIREFQEVRSLIEKNSHAHPDIRRALDLFRMVHAIDAHHLLYALGLFTVVELLLTHNPHGRYDSLNHQVATKMPLLERRFSQPLNYSVFGATEKKTLWKKLYEYRSVIAHGGRLDFGEHLKLLVSQWPANDFLLRAVKAVLRHALTEPELVFDLREV
jgi:hypothetical protein